MGESISEDGERRRAISIRGEDFFSIYRDNDGDL